VEILRDDDSGEHVLKASQWTEVPVDELQSDWCQLHGISIGSLRELAALIFGLLKGWLALELERAKR
jgi:hypothetical protein